MEDTTPLSAGYDTQKPPNIRFISMSGIDPRPQSETRYELYRLQEPRGLVQSITIPMHSSTTS